MFNQTIQSQGQAKKKSMNTANFEAKWGLIFISPWIVGFLIFFLVPIIASFLFSLYDFNLANPEEAHYIGITNWKRALLNDPEVPASFGKTFIFAAISLPIGMIFSLFLAILLNSADVLGKNLYRTLFYLPTMIPTVASVLIWAGVLNERTGWINLFLQNVLGINAIGSEGIQWLDDPSIIYFTYTMLGIWGIGNTMLITLAGLQNVPTSLYEAAKIDGAGWWRRLFNITLPMISPVVFYNLVLGVIGLMQYFLPAFVMNGGTGAPDGKTRFIMVYFYKQAFSYFNMGYGATLAWLIFAAGLVLAGLIFASAKQWVYYAGEGR